MTWGDLNVQGSIVQIAVEQLRSEGRKQRLSRIEQSKKRARRPDKRDMQPCHIHGMMVEHSQTRSSVKVERAAADAVIIHPLSVSRGLPPILLPPSFLLSSSPPRLCHSFRPMRGSHLFIISSCTFAWMFLSVPVDSPLR